MAQNPFVMNQIAQGFDFNPGGAFMQGQQDRMGMIAMQYQQQVAQMQMAQAQQRMEQDSALRRIGADMAPQFGLDAAAGSALGPMGLVEYGKATAPTPKHQVITDPHQLQGMGFGPGFVVQVAPDGKVNVLREPATPPPGPDAKDVFNNANTLRDEFNTLTKPQQIQFDAWSTILASAEDPSAAGDLSLIFAYMKLLDPGSTVREGEFANAETSGSVPDKIWVQYNKALTGERLVPAMREDFLDRSGRLFASAQKRANAAVTRYTGLANRAGVDPLDVVFDFSAGLPAKPKSATDYINNAIGGRNGTITRP